MCVCVRTHSAVGQPSAVLASIPVYVICKVDVKRNREGRREGRRMGMGERGKERDGGRDT